MADNLNIQCEGSTKKEPSPKKLVASEPEDRLSCLPRELQTLVLSSLPLHESIKTSILSKMWRKIWHSLPRLIFDYDEFPDMDGKLDHFLEFIHQVLIHHDESSIGAFELYLKECDTCIKNEWATFAVQHNVQKLTLQGQLEDQQQLPGCIFKCSSLIKLDLEIEKFFLRWPTAIALPNLKRLNLKFAILSEENFILDLSSSCPALEILSMILCNVTTVKVLSISSQGLKYFIIAGCRGIKECFVKLDTPSLKHLIYMDFVARDFSFGNLSSLSFACVMFREVDQMERRDAFSQCVMKTSQALCNVKHLTLNQPFMEFLSRVHNVSRQLTALSFDKLESLTLYLCPIKEQVEMTFLFLSRCPNIHGIVIDITRSAGRMPDILDRDIEYGNLVSPMMFKKLAFVKIEHFRGNKSEMELVRVLLDNAPESLKMEIVMELSLTGIVRKLKMIEILTYKGSSKVNLYFP